MLGVLRLLGLVAVAIGASFASGPARSRGDVDRELRIANERVKLTSDFLNRIAVGLVVAGLGTPFTSLLTDPDAFDGERPFLALFDIEPPVIVLALGLIALGFSLYLAARGHLGNLR